MSKTLTAEEFLDGFDLHTYYYPNGDTTKKPIHDKECSFCFYENYVIEAIEKYHKAKVESEIIPLIENEEFGRGAFNRDEYKSRILEKLQKLLEQ